MEYYIMKLYQKAKERNPEVEQGFNRFEPKVKRCIMGCFITMIAACIGMVVALLLSPNKLWYFIGVGLCMISMFILMWIDNKDEKKHMEKYKDSHLKKLEILDSVLKDVIESYNEDKIEKLIAMYQIYVDKRNQREKRQNSIILTIFAAFAGVLTMSFEHMEILGIGFSVWICLAVLLLAFVVLVVVLLYFYLYFDDSLKRKYEMMIKDLKEVLLVKF